MSRCTGRRKQVQIVSAGASEVVAMIQSAATVTVALGSTSLRISGLDSGMYGLWEFAFASADKYIYQFKFRAEFTFPRRS
jgi:hypothetical protein